MTKIAVLGLRGVPATFGGVEHQCEELYSRLAARGHDIVIHARSPYVPQDIHSYRGMTIRRLPTLNTRYTEAFAHAALAVLDVLGSDVDIVHFYSQGPCLLSPFVRLLKRRAKVFFTCGGLDWQRKKWPPWASGIIRLGEVCSALAPHRCITVSRELKRYYKRTYGIHAHYIPNGVPTGVTRALESFQDVGLRPQGYYLFVGRLVPEKRIHDILEAYLMKPRECRLVVVGESAGTDEYVRELKQTAADNPGVHFLGYQYGQRLEELFSNARAFINASEVEGLPLTVLEAFSHGVMSFLSAIPPHKEIMECVNQADSLFSVGDTKALSSLMGWAETWSRENLQAWGGGVAEAVARHYSWDRAALALERLYEDAVRGEPP